MKTRRSSQRTADGSRRHQRLCVNRKSLYRDFSAAITGHRYYNASTGRWLSRDPLGEPGFELSRGGKVDPLGGGPNLYAFVGNNPIDQTDYLGLAVSSIDASVEACMRLPTPAQQQACLSDLLDTLGASKECCALAVAVQVAKRGANALGKCNSNDTCGILKGKSAAWLAVALARSRLHKQCFSGGDPGHQQALAQVWQVIGDCTTYQVKNGCTGPL